MEKTLKEISSLQDQRGGFICDNRGALPVALLVAVSKPQMDSALLQMALNVALGSLKDNAELQKALVDANADEKRRG